MKDHFADIFGAMLEEIFMQYAYFLLLTNFYSLFFICINGKVFFVPSNISFET